MLAILDLFLHWAHHNEFAFFVNDSCESALKFDQNGVSYELINDFRCLKMVCMQYSMLYNWAKNWLCSLICYIHYPHPHPHPLYLSLSLSLSLSHTHKDRQTDTRTHTHTHTHTHTQRTTYIHFSSHFHLAGSCGFHTSVSGGVYLCVWRCLRTCPLCAARNGEH